ncbi:hypothetical protein HU200_014989 [Digitaria exilis]|uniref:Uncharacterized protein n=1 Tax=Digitaria exilis TaxID=1010633 RepID=A0A835FAN9_9POAL|nr:hypothetical protein HU200_014989 [Digitaria exilis]
MDLRRGRDLNGRSMLHLAAKAGALDFCRFLVEKLGFSANSTSAHGETPILVATEIEDDEVDIVPVLRYLLARGGDPAAADEKGYTPLHNAAEFGHIKAVRLLLSKGVPVDPLNSRGTPLHLATAMDHDQPNRVVNHVLSPLMMACCGRSLKCMKLLVEAGADVNFKSPSGRPVLFQAVDNGITDIVRSRDSIMKAAAMASSPFEVAIEAAVNGNLLRLREIASTMDLRRARGFKGRNLLHFVAEKGRLDLCRFLIEESGETPILVATSIMEDRTDDVVPVLRYLLDHGGDPAAPDDRGYTPLHNAAEYGHHEAVRVLLSEGVPVNPLNRRGTPLHLAAAKGHDQAGADVNLKGPTGKPVLFNAVEDGLTNIVKFLLEVGADPNHGTLPIMLAAAGEQHEIVEILLPCTKRIPHFPDWSVDGVIRTMKNLRTEPQATGIDPHDATLFANLSLCWLRLGEGELALSNGQQCKALTPQWVKAWYREGMALSMLKLHRQAVEVFEEALKLDPSSEEIKKGLR